MFSSLVKRLMSGSSSSKIINTVTIIGAGAMGSGIAQVVAQAGKKVILVDESEAILQRGAKIMESSLQRITSKKLGNDASAISKSVSEVMANISLSTDAVEAASSTDLVIEAIVEDRDAKRKLFKKLDSVAPPSTIFASNTSSFLIGTIAEVTDRKDRFGGLHFFNPVPVMKLLEIVVTPELSTTTNDALQEFGKSVGKVCVTCKDTPGFIVNRLLIPYIVEAALMAERGDAKFEDIDIAMKLGCGYPNGPFELMDLVGVEVMDVITKGWKRDYPEADFKTSKLISKRVSENRLGRKTGNGFYSYQK